MKHQDEALLIFQELDERCLFEDAKIMATFIKDTNALCNVSYSKRRILFQQQKYQAILRIPCNTSLDHFFALHALYIGNETMNNLVKQSVWIDKLLDQSESLMQYCADDPYLIYLRAKILFANDQSEEALSLLANCLWQPIGKSNFLIWRLFSLNVPCLAQFNTYTKDLDCFMKSLSLLYMGAKRQFFIPLNLVKSFIKANLDNPFILALEAAFYANQNQTTNTINIATIRNTVFYLDFADIYSHFFFAQQDHHTLKQLVFDIQQLNKHDFIYYIVMGNYYSLQKQPQTSIQMFLKASHVCNQSDPLPFVLMGFEYFGMDDRSEALECYYKAQRISANNDYRVIYALAWFHERVGFTQRAIEYYTLLVEELRPYDARFYIALAECHSYLEHNEEMLKYALLAYQLQSNTPSYANTIGIAYRLLNQYDLALTWFKKALLQHDNVAETYMRIEDVFFCIQHCIKRNDVAAGRQFMCLLTATSTGNQLQHVYANEIAILQEQLDRTWTVDVVGDGDMVSIPEISSIFSTRIHSTVVDQHTPSRFDPFNNTTV